MAIDRTAVRHPSPPVLLAVLLALLVGLPACASGQAPEPVAAGEREREALRSVPADDRVDLRIYLRSGSGPTAHLRAVTREVPIVEDLPRRAVELLLAGRAPGDPEDLRSPLPTSAQVLGLRVEGDTAFVDLSPEVVTDAAAVGPTPEHELLALAALANTLTEFPEIDVVRLSVAGRHAGVHVGVHGGVDVGRFWGGWGLPPLLRRDASVVGAPRPGEGIPDVREFRAGPQTVGGPHAPAVSVRSVRTQDRLGYLRLVVELADGNGQPAPSVPPVAAGVEGGRLVLRIDDVVSYAAEVAPGGRLSLDDGVFEAVEVDDAELPGAVRLGVVPGRNAFLLHTLTSPTRVVLDVRK